MRYCTNAKIVTCKMNGCEKRKMAEIASIERMLCDGMEDDCTNLMECVCQFVECTNLWNCVNEWYFGISCSCSCDVMLIHVVVFLLYWVCIKGQKPFVHGYWNELDGKHHTSTLSCSFAHMLCRYGPIYAQQTMYYLLSLMYIYTVTHV